MPGKDWSIAVFWIFLDGKALNTSQEWSEMFLDQAMADKGLCRGVFLFILFFNNSFKK